MTKRSISSGAVLLALALLFIAITVLANYALRGWRLDLTENRLYTTAPGTDRILKSIKEPINLYFFFSEKTANQLPQLKSYGIRVRELLEELAARSGGKVRLHVIDPQPFSEEEDRADALGVDGTPVGASGAKLYLGLAGTNSTDGHAAIEFFDPSKEQFLEYDVIKLIYQLANPKKPVLAWLSTLPMEPGFDQQSGQMREPWVIYSEAQQLFDVRPLAPTAAKIDPDVSVLVLVHPKNLSPATQFAIDQFALRGGHIMVFVDPIAEADRSGADPQNPMASMDADKSSSLPQLLTAWGVHFDPTQVVADRDHALSVTMRQGEAPVEHLGVLGFDKASFASNDVITAGLSVVNVATAGHLEPVKGAHTKFEPLLRSSTDSELLPVERFRMLFDPSTLREGFKATGVRYTIAARVTGDVGTAFPAGPPPGVTLPPGQIDLKTSVKPLNLVVFADTDLLSDYLWVHEQSMFGQRLTQAWAGNGDLVLNALDNLAGSADLISVRGRASYARPFERVVRLQRIADDRFRDKEQELQRQLQTTEQKLTQLQSAKGADSSALIITPAQEQEIEQFEQEKLQIRKQLRAVRAGLDAEIHRLGNTLKILNIIVMPALFALLALAVAAWRRERRRVRP
ncbi:MAG TPA: Gldg family protein [Steroidobacteraceae bacterium]|nr:Gldg family protein [Steroidobacteraceae bacterium]